MFKQVNRLSLIAGDLRGARVLGSLFNVHVEERIFFDAGVSTHRVRIRGRVHSHFRL
jgi:hypothetical protein